MEKVEWQVEGMTCSNCALTVKDYLAKEGMADIKVNAINGAVSFIKAGDAELPALMKGIDRLGYAVKEEQTGQIPRRKFLPTNKSRFLFTLPFTLILMMHMLPGVAPHWLMNPVVQLALCIPVFVVGMWVFGRSAWKSIRHGVPNMNVLISIGAIASFVYSFTGLVLGLGHQYLFFETTASIITLVFLGNYLEEASINSTQKAINSLASSQKVMANMIAFDEHHHEHIFPVESQHLKSGDLILIKHGEQVPADAKILSGDCTVNEALLTGESSPVFKLKKDLLLGGSVIESGTVKAQVTAAGKDTVLSGIVRMVENAQAEKPPMQKMADKISAIFVPLVVAIAALTFVGNYLFFDVAAGSSLMRAIAVLVISCPCAMGLATPAAIAVGLGRAAKKGILFRNASALESFQTIRQVVFDKTGTLTTGKFALGEYQTSINDGEFRRLAFSLMRFSNHPLSVAVTKAWRSAAPLSWKTFQEIKGMGVEATDNSGNTYQAGSYKFLANQETKKEHSIFLIQNGNCIGWIDAKDELRQEAKDVIDFFKKKKIRTVLLSGDRLEKTRLAAAQLGIEEFFAEQSPGEKLQKVAELNQMTPTAMVGDGINDAPAMAKASLGISLSDASDLARQTSDVILMNQGIRNLPEALGLGKHTFLTIKQNLFWAFFYNIIAIPIAATGMLTPTFAALAMGLSDVVLALNSTRLFIKKVV